MAQFYFKFLRFIATIASCAVMAEYSGFSWIQVSAPITLEPISAEGTVSTPSRRAARSAEARFRGHHAHPGQPLDDGRTIEVGRPPQGFVFVHGRTPKVLRPGVRSGAASSANSQRMLACVARIDDLLDVEALGRPERRAQLADALLDFGASAAGSGAASISAW